MHYIPYRMKLDYCVIFWKSLFGEEWKLLFIKMFFRKRIRKYSTVELISTENNTRITKHAEGIFYYTIIQTNKITMAYVTCTTTYYTTRRYY